MSILKKSTSRDEVAHPVIGVAVEIFHNCEDGREYGSLMWILDQTKTSMGKRLLKQWVGKPLIDFK